MCRDRVEFADLARRKLRVDFSGGGISSDAGLLLLREVDRHLKLTERVVVYPSDALRDGSRIQLR